ncbi:hypothetical protein I307_00001 [Cryptococcus deuterogattii 99/473]|nr:hypothetical protein I307_00001 [Cryptococcus deuterogattii 99/473]
MRQTRLFRGPERRIQRYGHPRPPERPRCFSSFHIHHLFGRSCCLAGCRERVRTVNAGGRGCSWADECESAGEGSV